MHIIDRPLVELLQFYESDGGGQWRFWDTRCTIRHPEANAAIANRVEEEESISEVLLPWR